jgi:hypothetical protein
LKQLLSLEKFSRKPKFLKYTNLNDPPEFHRISGTPAEIREKNPPNSGDLNGAYHHCINFFHFHAKKGALSRTVIKESIINHQGRSSAIDRPLMIDGRF